MRFIPTKIHGMLDYLIGALLIASPWVFNFADHSIQTYLPIVLGAGMIMYSFFTDYEEGVIRRIPMSIHLKLDIAFGIVLAVSPWLFQFNNYVYAPHLIIGLIEVLTACCTSTHPFRSRFGQIRHAA